jgi:hypothetical protein
LIGRLSMSSAPYHCRGNNQTIGIDALTKSSKAQALRAASFACRGQAKLLRRRTPSVSCLIVANHVPSLTFITINGGVGQTRVMELGFAVARKMDNIQTGSLSSGLSRKPQPSARADVSCLEVTTRAQVGAVPHSSCKRAPSEVA